MSHDHPVDPYRNESQALLNMVRLFDIKGTAKLYLTGYQQLNPDRHVWTFDIINKHYALLLDAFIADEQDEAIFLKKFLLTQQLEAISLADKSGFVAETYDFNSAVLFEYETTL